MIPVSFDTANFTFTKPKNWSDEQCMDLVAQVGYLPINSPEESYPHIVSCWQPNKEDLEEINRTGKIYLAIVGTSMPPVFLSSTNPFNPSDNA